MYIKKFNTKTNVSAKWHDDSYFMIWEALCITCFIDHQKMPDVCGPFMGFFCLRPDEVLRRYSGKTEFCSSIIHSRFLNLTAYQRSMTMSVFYSIQSYQITSQFIPFLIWISVIYIGLMFVCRIISNYVRYIAKFIHQNNSLQTSRSLRFLQKFFVLI